MIQGLNSRKDQTEGRLGESKDFYLKTYRWRREKGREESRARKKVYGKDATARKEKVFKLFVFKKGLGVPKGWKASSKR